MCESDNLGWKNIRGKKGVCTKRESMRVHGFVLSIIIRLPSQCLLDKAPYHSLLCWREEDSSAFWFSSGSLCLFAVRCKQIRIVLFFLKAHHYSDLHKPTINQATRQTSPPFVSHALYCEQGGLPSHFPVHCCPEPTQKMSALLQLLTLDSQLLLHHHHWQ